MTASLHSGWAGASTSTESRRAAREGVKEGMREGVKERAREGAETPEASRTLGRTPTSGLEVEARVGRQMVGLLAEENKLLKAKVTGSPSLCRCAYFSSGQA